jgi:hypothetical protein
MFPAEQVWAALAGVTHILLNLWPRQSCGRGRAAGGKAESTAGGIYELLAYLGQKH